MAEKRITVKESFERVKAFLTANGADSALVEFIEKRIDLTERKNGGAKKLTATQIENEGIKAVILEIVDEPKTVTEIVKALAERGTGDFANQKISALANALVREGKAEKIADKKRSLFKRVEG